MAEPDVEAPVCKHGHPMTADNVYEWHPAGSTRVVRKCRACQIAARDRYLARRARKTTPEEAALDELGVAILRLLPEQGAKLGKYLSDARSAKQLLKALDDRYLTSSMVARKLIELQRFDYVLVVSGSRETKNARGWQRTKKATEVLTGRSEEAQHG